VNQFKRIFYENIKMQM